jgi:hypothetical protein
MRRQYQNRKSTLSNAPRDLAHLPFFDELCIKTAPEGLDRLSTGRG